MADPMPPARARHSELASATGATIDRFLMVSEPFGSRGFRDTVGLSLYLLDLL